VLCIQPGSGDVLQFMKAGIAEIPDIVVVTKADLGALADKAVQDVRGALALAGGPRFGPDVPVQAVAGSEGRGVDELVEALRGHWAWLEMEARLSRRRHSQAEAWLVDAVREGWGRTGVARAAPQHGLHLTPEESPFRRLRALGALLG
jgi:LAO/AO transport system kinase